MEEHFTYFSFFIPSWLEDSSSWEKFLFALLVMVVWVVLGAKATKLIREKFSKGAEEDVKSLVVPSEKITPFGLSVLIVEKFIHYADEILGKENRRHIPFCAAVFFLILVNNFLGLIPGMPAATTTVWVNVAIALVVFIYFNYWGIKAHGFINYLLHFAGPIPSASSLSKGVISFIGVIGGYIICTFIFGVEMLSTHLRVLTLNLRLYWNITADHIVLGIFTNLLGAPLAAPFYLLGAFVSFVQALIFGTLTMIYIALAIEKVEEH